MFIFLGCLPLLHVLPHFEHCMLRVGNLLKDWGVTFISEHLKVGSLDRTGKPENLTFDVLCILSLSCLFPPCFIFLTGLVEKISLLCIKHYERPGFSTFQNLNSPPTLLFRTTLLLRNHQLQNSTVHTSLNTLLHHRRRKRKSAIELSD